MKMKSRKSFTLSNCWYLELPEETVDGTEYCGSVAVVDDWLLVNCWTVVVAVNAVVVVVATAVELILKSSADITIK